MVKITGRQNGKVPGGMFGFVAIAVGALFVILGIVRTLGTDMSPEAVAPLTTFLRNNAEPEFDKDVNSAKMKMRRSNLKKQCDDAKTSDEVDKVGKATLEGFAMPVTVKEQPRNHDLATKRCKRVVMDFGANIGDTSGHVIDAGFHACIRKDLEASTQETHFNIESKEFEHVQKRNMLTKNLEKLMEMQGNDIGPEDYCYYGIEGNPHFTDRLRKIEDHVMAIRPRPIQHMHFFTESVGAGEDGKTKLYLDTINTEKNFWGSSIFKDHQDVRKSAGGKDADTVAAPVMGYTIGTLMRKTLTYFDENAEEDDKKGNHLLLKVDIEGGEYPLLHQAVEEGTLCEFTKNGNTADLFIEFHSAKVTGKHDYIGQTKDMKEKLSACGVTFRNLAAWWA